MMQARRGKNAPMSRGSAKCLRAMWLGTALLLPLAPSLTAQQQAPKQPELADAPVPKQEPKQENDEKHSNPFNTTIEVLARRSIVFPEIATDPNPLNSKQKFELFLDQSVAPFHFVASAAGAGIGQARNALPGYGQEWNGYGKRFGSSLASATSNSFFGTYVLASMMRKDPRYFPSLHGSFGHRVGYALSRIVVARTDERTLGANWPGIFAPLLAESLATAYLPAKEQTAGKTFQRYGWRLGLNTATNGLREYWPTIFRSLRITKIAPGLGSNGGAPQGPGHPVP